MDVVFNNSRKDTDDKEEQDLTHEEIWDDQALIQHYDETLKKAKLHLACKLNSGTSISDSDCSSNQRMNTINGHARGKSHHTTHSKKKKKKSRKKNEWHTGDPCRAVYADDGKTYEATIIGLDNTSGMCHVRFLGYNNDEHVALSSLLKSNGEGARKKQFEVSTQNGAQSEADDSFAAESDACTEEESSNKRPSPFQSPTKSERRRPRNFPNHSNDSIPHLPLLPPPPALGLVDSSDPESSEALHTMLMSWYMTGYHTGYYQGLQHGRRSVPPQPSSNDRSSQHNQRKK